MQREAQGAVHVGPVVWWVGAMALVGAVVLSAAMGPSGLLATSGTPSPLQVSDMVLPPIDPGINAPVA